MKLGTDRSWARLVMGLVGLGSSLVGSVWYYVCYHSIRRGDQMESLVAEIPPPALAQYLAIVGLVLLAAWVGMLLWEKARRNQPMRKLRLPTEVTPS